MKQDEKPLISVLMGVYNCKSRDMLEQAVHSILQQTHSHLELIICDDGSTNDTPLWLAELAKQDDRIRLLRNETNQYLAGALNRCITAAKGDYLARQDDDDISHPERLAKQLAFLETHPEVDFVGSNCNLYTPERGVHGQWTRPIRPEKQDFLFNSPFIHGSLLFRRRCFAEIGGYPILQDIARYEDYMLFMQLYATGLQGANLEEPLYTFYFDEQQRKIPLSERRDEAVVRWHGFRLMGLLPKGFPYVLKPLVLAMIPAKLLHRLRRQTSTK